MRRTAPGLIVVASATILGVLALTFGATAAAPEPAGYVVVRHVISASPDGTLIFEEESRTEVSAQFVVNQHIWGLNSIPVPVSYNSAGAPDGLDVAGIIQGAIANWNNAGSAFSFTWAGSSTGGTGSCDNNIDTDGKNTIRFENLTGLTLGQTCTIYPIGSNSKLIEFDMQLDNEQIWSAGLPVPGGKYDLPTTILHELGHAAGLGHSAQNSAVMYFQVSAGQSKRTLTDDDVAGIRAAYPGSPTATPTDTSTPTPTTVTQSPSVTQSPTATPTTFGPTLTPPALSNRVRTPQLARD